MLMPRKERPGRCPHCSTFMNWERQWGDLWTCLGCGEQVRVGETKSTREVVEKAIRMAKEKDRRW